MDIIKLTFKYNLRDNLLLIFILFCPLFYIYSIDETSMFRNKGELTIPWDIGVNPLEISLPQTGGPGISYSITDNMNIGFMLNIPALMNNSIMISTFYNYSNSKNREDFIQLSTKASLDITSIEYQDLYIDPSLALTCSFGSISFRTYLVVEAQFIIFDFNKSPLIIPTLKTGITFPSLENLSIELTMEGIGTYSSVTRSNFGQPILLIGMVHDL